MKLNVVVNIYSERRRLSKLLNSFQKQTSKDFQLILVLESLKKDLVKIIEDHEKSFKNENLIIVFNSSRQGITKNLLHICKFFKGDYVFITNPSSTFKHSFVEQAIGMIEKRKADIVEFNPNLSGNIDWKSDRRLIIDKVVTIKNNPEVVAYSFPLITNKFIKTSIFKKALFSKKHRMSNFILSINLLYLVFAFAKTYSNFKIWLVKNNHISNVALNPINFFNDWKDIRNYYQQHISYLLIELDYAMLYHLKLVVPSYIKQLKKENFFQRIKSNKTSILDWYFKKLEKFNNDTFKLITKTNKYLMSNLAEVSLLQTNYKKINYLKILKKIN